MVLVADRLYWNVDVVLAAGLMKRLAGILVLILPAFVLLNWINRSEFISHLRDECGMDPSQISQIDLSDLEDQWRAWFKEAYK